MGSLSQGDACNEPAFPQDITFSTGGMMSRF